MLKNAPSVGEISVILVSWRDKGETREAVASLAAARRRASGKSPRVSLFVVDNGGGTAVSDAVLGLWPEASLLVNDHNRGLGPAANQAAALAPGDVLFFVNPDTRVEGDFFPELARGFIEHPEAVAIAPRLLDWNEAAPSATVPGLTPPDREDQFSFQLRRLPDLASDARELLLIDHLAPNNAGRRRFRYADRDPEAPLSVEQAAAAALAVRKSAFAGVGGFDERFVPAWFEDVDLCSRLLDKGKIVYWPAARLRHRGRASSEALGYASFLPVYYENALRYRTIHYGLTGRVLYRALLVGGMLLRLALLSFRPSSPRPHRESARAYLATLAVAVGLARPGIPNR